MKICIDARNIRQSPSGLCRYALHMVQGMAKIDQTNEYLILRDKRYREKVVDNDNFQDIFDPLKDTGSVQNALFGRFVVNPLEVDVFHSLNQVVPFGLKAKKIITTVHDLMWFDCPDLSFDTKRMAFGAKLLANTSFSYSYKKADHIISISKTTDYFLKKRFPQYGDKSVVISHHDLFFLDKPTTDVFDYERLNETLPEKYILSVGNTKPYKNVEGLIEGFSKIYQQYPDVKIVIAGRVDRREALEKWAESKGVLAQIYFVGKQISEHDLKLLFVKAQFFAFLSFYEGYGIPLLEAMSLGCPVLGSTAPIVTETTGEVALYADPHDSNDIAEKMKELLDSEVLRKTLTQQGYDYLESLKDYDSVRLTHELYLA